MSPDLETMMEFADELPSLPTAVVKAMALLRDENAQNHAIAAALQQDQALVAQVLKLANSPYYGVSRRVSTVEQSILVLGRKVVRSLVVAAAAQDFLSRPQAGYMLSRGDLWSQSLAAGCAASLIALKVGYKPADEAFVAGLLHAIGKVVLSAYLAEAADELAARLADGTRFDELERELVQIDHATLGGMIADRWQLPPHLGEAIRRQHDPLGASGDTALACIVHLAKALAMMLGVGLGVDGLQYELCEAAITELGLTAEDLDALTADLIDQVRQPELV